MKKRVEKPENHERWLLTYSDLITLLMIFFVVLYSASSVNESKYKQLATSMGDVFTDGSSVLGSAENSGSSTDEPRELKPLVQTEEEKLQGIETQVNDIVKDLELEGSVTTSIEERGLIIRFTDSLFFDSEKADIKEELKPKLISVSNILNKFDNYVRIEGHTDNLPITTSDYHSNWQLSSVRASNVVEFLISYGSISPSRLSAVGYGEYRPVADNATEEGRAKNRRVDILILNNKFDNIEMN